MAAARENGGRCILRAGISDDEQGTRLGWQVEVNAAAVAALFYAPQIFFLNRSKKRSSYSAKHPSDLARVSVR
jgi:hypothetical protein